jgi:DNA-binding beta-propeller fold protein YncE
MSLRRRTVLTVSAAAALGGMLAASVAEKAVAAPAGRGAPALVATPPYGEIVVSDSGVIRVFAPDADGNVAPVRTIEGSNTGLGLTIAVDLDQNGNIWVMDYGNSRIAEFDAGADGNVAQIRVIEPTSDVSNARGLALSPDGSLAWVGNYNNSTIPAFSMTANGSVAPVRKIVGGSTGLSYENDVALTPNGSFLWTTDSGYNTVLAFDPAGPADQAPSWTIPLGDGHEPQGVAADVFGSVFVSDSDADAVYAYGLSDPSTPARTITGDQTGITDPRFIHLDALGRVWLADQGNYPTVDPSVIAFGAAADGNVAPVRHISGPLTGLVSPQDVAVFGAKPSEPTSPTARGRTRKVVVKWAAPDEDGGGVLGYLVRRKNTKSGPWKGLALVTDLRYVDQNRKPDHRYRYSVVAVNDFGASHPSATVSAVPHD